MSRALAKGALVGIVLALLLVAPVRTALAELQSVRVEAKALEQQAMVRSGSIVPPASSWSGGPDRAAAQLAARIQATAARGGVLVEEAAPAAPPAATLAAVRIRLSGSEQSVVSLADALERGTPLVRFRQWRMTGIGEGGVRLEAIAVLPWR